ncbi:unnamed protein product [Callosobruchus maculatus]|uniref:DNA replication licensing factor MCM7 n=1 Tax=Callosobruchus maculatus TaxID=64391 RepID=A0A653BLD9_CALMS|nr:unnamed protein product [Callosobruchus maculatus]
MAKRDYQKDKDQLKTFLLEYCTQDEFGKKTFKYSEQLSKIAHREQTAMWIELDDITSFSDDLAEAITQNTRRYVNLLSDIVFDLLPTFVLAPIPAKDALDVYIQHRLMMENRMRQPNEHRDARNKFPPELLRRYELYFEDSSLSKDVPIREVKAQHVGRLVTVRGVVIRCTEVKPMMCVATYTCDRCGAETYQPVQSLSFMPQQVCQSEDCRLNKSGGRLYLQTRGSKFVKFQEIRLQEMSDQVPVGHIPRSLTVYCRGEVTRNALPGDHVAVTGIFLPLIKQGFKQLTGGLLSDTFLEAHAKKYSVMSEK